MSNILVLLPLLLLLVIGFLYWKVVRKLAAGRGGIFQHKGIVKIIVITYAVILLLAPFVYELLPSGKAADFTKVPTDHLDRETRELEQAIYDGRLEDVAPQYIQQKWEGTYKGEALRLREAEDAALSIVVERKPENDGLLEGMYIASVVYQGADFSRELNKLDFFLDGKELHLIGAGVTTQIEGAVMKQDLLLSQFTGEKDTLFGDSSMRDLHYVYLKVPKDLKIEGTDDLFFNYIGEVEVE